MFFSRGHCRVLECSRTFSVHPFYSITVKQATQLLSESGRPSQVDKEVDRTVRLGQHQVHEVGSQKNVGVFTGVKKFWHQQFGHTQRDIRSSRDDVDQRNDDEHLDKRHLADV